MYEKGFYISSPVWNNIFSYEKRKNKKIFIPSLKQIHNLEEIELGQEIVFEEANEKWDIEGYIGLENLYEIDMIIAEKKKKMFIFDNHNHAYFFWHLAHHNKIIWKENVLFHIDEHADMRIPEIFLEKTDQDDLEKVFEYTNFVLNVWNYIVPAERDGLIKKIYQIRTETAIIEIQKMDIKEKECILNLDLDFFHPDLDFIDYKLKKDLVVKLSEISKIITIATSPYFMNQARALEILHDIYTF